MSLLRRKKFTINVPDPLYNVVYLGNVATIMAKGEACYEKPLALIWRAYNTRSRADVPMQLVVTRQGLKAYTKQQGVTEYFAHRLTYCTAPDNYPKVFVWIYRHEGKKLKPEVRCHAALCKKPDVPRELACKLSESIASALSEYKREKISRQNVRLYGGGLMPLRKEILSTGIQNFRPPVRSKSAPRLGSIEESILEEEIEEELCSDIGEALTPLQSTSEESSPEPDRASLGSDYVYVSASPNPPSGGADLSSHDSLPYTMGLLHRGASSVGSSVDSDFMESGSSGGYSPPAEDFNTARPAILMVGAKQSVDGYAPPEPVFPTSIHQNGVMSPAAFFPQNGQHLNGHGHFDPSIGHRHLNDFEPQTGGGLPQFRDISPAEKLSGRVKNLTLLQLGEPGGKLAEPDAISDESGYHEEKSDSHQICSSHHGRYHAHDSPDTADVLITYL